MSGEGHALAAWLERIERGHTQQIDLGLERVARVAAQLTPLPGGARVITVAGTNGKGSCVAVLERLLLARGARVAAYTSPHLRRYNERVRVQGVAIDDATLCAGFEAVEAARGDTSLTYFEYGTLAALEVFCRAAPDWIVLEVGLGGRLDAVNVVDPDIAIVTSIQIDHVDWLGPDRESIGREKGGIFRRARPAVVGEREVPASLRHAARDRGALWFGIGTEFDGVDTAGGGWRWQGTDATGARMQRELPQPPQLLGSNVACALQALALADALPDAALLARELPRIGLEGRYQRRRVGSVQCVLDVAHNAAGAELLAARLAADPVPGRTIAVFAAMADKDLAAMCRALDPVLTGWHLAQLPEARAAGTAQLRDALVEIGVRGEVRMANSVAEAMESALRMLGSGDRLLVCGSFHVVGPALDWLDARSAGSGDDA